MQEGSAGRSEHGLKSGALGFVGTLTIGVASVAPAYSLAAILGLTSAEVGAQLPAVLILSFVPMLFVASAYYYLNQADPDCGTTFAWASRALGPTAGWLAGWAIITAGIIVIGLLANTAALYTLQFVGWQAGADSQTAVTTLAVVFIIGATLITVRGTEISARAQYALLGVQLVSLLLFAGVVLVKVLGDDGGATSVTPAASWYSPFAVDGGVSPLVAGLLLGVFAYWGWDSSVAVNEETSNSGTSPGKAAVVSTLVLLAIYLLVSTASVAWLGPDALAETEDEGVLGLIAGQVFASPLDKLVVLGVALSALSSTQTTVLPSSRTVLSMARHGAYPARLGAVHERFLTPHVATIGVGALALVYYVIFSVFSEGFYGESLGALGLLICANYGINALACVVFFRRRFAGNLKLTLLAGVLPGIGCLAFTALAVKTLMDLAEGGVEDLTYYLGLQAPLTITIALFALGLVLLVAWRGSAGGRAFFARRRQTAEDAERSDDDVPTVVA